MWRGVISRNQISNPSASVNTISENGTVPPRGVGTVLVAARPMLLLTNTVSGRRLFHKQSPEFCIECHTATILDGRMEFIGRVSSNTIRRDSLAYPKNIKTIMGEDQNPNTTTETKEKAWKTTNG